MKTACWNLRTMLDSDDNDRPLRRSALVSNSLGLILTSKPSVRYALPRKDHLSNMEQATPFSGAGEERKNIASQVLAS